MIKKIIFTFLICCLLTISCGKKGPPLYEEPEQKVEMFTNLTNKA